MKRFTLLKMMLLTVCMLGSIGVFGETSTYTYATGSGSGSTGVWTYTTTDFTILQRKNSSSSAIPTTYAEMRIYSGHSLEIFPTVAGKKITLIEATCSTAAYATELGKATVLAGTSSSSATTTSGISTVNGTAVAFDLSGVADCEFVKFTLSAQARTTSWKITYTSSGVTATAAPTFSPVGGTYTAAQDITLSSTTSGAKIYYTTDGVTEPTSASTLYTSPIALNTTATTTIKAIAYDSNDANPSAAVSATYVIDLNPTITITQTTIPEITTTVNVAKTETVSVTASNLSGEITAEISGTDAALFTVNSPLDAAGGTLTITYTPTAAGAHTATLTLSSAGATGVTRALTGVATLDAPVAMAATAITQTSFTANWEGVTGAGTYDLSVYTRSGNAITEEFNGATTAPAGWNFTDITGTYTSATYAGAASPSLKLEKTDAQVLTSTYTTAAKEISFWIRGASTDTNSALLVEGFDGTNWATIEDIKPLPTTGTIKTYNATTTPALAADLTQFRFTYTKSVGNLAFDDFTWSDVVKQKSPDLHLPD